MVTFTLKLKQMYLPLSLEERGLRFSDFIMSTALMCKHVTSPNILFLRLKGFRYILKSDNYTSVELLIFMLFHYSVLKELKMTL